MPNLRRRNSHNRGAAQKCREDQGTAQRVNGSKAKGNTAGQAGGQSQAETS